MEFGVAKSLRFIPFHQMARSLGPDQSLEFKFFHAFSGCATTSSLSGKARKKFLARGHPRIRLRHYLKKNGVSDVKRSERDKRNSAFQGWQTDWKHSTYQRFTKTPVLKSMLQSSKWQQSLCKDLDGQNACQLGCQRLKNEMIPLCRELLKYGCKKGFTRGGKHLKSDLKCTELCQWFGHSSNGKPCWFIAYLTLVSEKIYWLILTTATYRVEHCMKNDEIQPFSNPYFLVFGQN